MTARRKPLHQGVSAGKILAAFVAIVASIVTVLLAPFPLAGLLIRDDPIPPALTSDLGPAKHRLTSQLERRLSHLRFAGIDTEEKDQAILIKFEMRDYPFLEVRRTAFLVSFCKPLAEIKPVSLSGGIGPSRSVDELNLAYIRTLIQASCSQTIR